MDLSEKLSLGVRGDVGGFGVGSDLTWIVIPGIAYQLSPRFTLKAGYRIYNVDVEEGSGANKFEFDIEQEGPILGLTIHF